MGVMGIDRGSRWPALRAGGVTTDEALTELRMMFIAGLRRTLSGRAGSDGAFIEDIVQEATLRVLERLDHFRGESRFTTWSTAIAVRAALTELRRARWRDVSLSTFRETRGPPGSNLPTQSCPRADRRAKRKFSANGQDSGR